MAVYLPSTPKERAAMLESIGAKTYDDLYVDVPGGAYSLKLDLPFGVSEADLRADMEALAAQNTHYDVVFRGAGAYRHFRPAVVDSVLSSEILQTAYTPYQAEISQGVLQSIFEYQTMNCELTGMDVACASIYDGATAATEAAMMCQERKRSRVVVSAGVHPHTRQTLATYCEARGIAVDEIALEDGQTPSAALADVLGADAACVLIQQPNYYGVMEDASTLIKIAHDCTAKAVCIADPVSLGILASPGEMDADIAVCEGQALGLPLSFGGPYVGMLSCKEKLTRKLPGRIVGQTVDAQGRRAFVLTLQAREQHIRREKASSNICSNEALCALAAGAYLASLGPQGLAYAARCSYSLAHFMAVCLCALDGVDLAYQTDFFNEFVTVHTADVFQIEQKLAAEGILSGLPLELPDGRQGILWCCTEMNTREQIEKVVTLLRGVE